MTRPPFIGAPKAAWRADGFALGRWTANRWGEAVAPHGHDNGHFMLVIGGHYRTETKSPAHGDRLPILIYNPPGTWHRDRFESPGLFFSIDLDPGRGREAAEAGCPNSPVRLSAPRQHAAVRRILRACADPVPGDEAIAESLCLELVGETGVKRTNERARPLWLSRTLQRLQDRPEAAAPVAELAREAGVHPVHLARAFRRHFGCTPGEMQIGLRLGRAAEALRSGARPIAEIALDCGFADQSHFSRRFRGLWGVTPATYRRMFV